MVEHEVTLETAAPLPSSITESTVQNLISHVLDAEGVEEPWLVGIQFIDDSTMQSAHVEFMGIDEPTDIMTFPYADEDDIWEDAQAGGDLMISVDRARANAFDAGWNEEDEIFFLIAHGLLHLLGWNDHSDADRAKMLERQRELLESWRGRERS